MFVGFVFTRDESCAVHHRTFLVSLNPVNWHTLRLDLDSSGHMVTVLSPGVLMEMFIV